MGSFPAQGGRPAAAPPYFYAAERLFRSRFGSRGPFESIPTFSGIDFVESGLGPPSVVPRGGFRLLRVGLARQASSLSCGQVLGPSFPSPPRNLCRGDLPARFSHQVWVKSPGLLCVWDHFLRKGVGRGLRPPRFRRRSAPFGAALALEVSFGTIPMLSGINFLKSGGFTLSLCAWESFLRKEVGRWPRPRISIRRSALSEQLWLSRAPSCRSRYFRASI